MAASLGATRTAAGTELLYARSAVVLHAAAFGLQAIDQINLNFTDREQLESDAKMGAILGYQGKQVIHPAQIEVVQHAFTPEPEQVQEAQKLLDAYVDHIARGEGAFAMDGKLVDLAHVHVAERIIERAKAGGVIP